MEELLKVLHTRWESDEGAQCRSLAKGDMFTTITRRKGTNSTNKGFDDNAYVTLRVNDGSIIRSMTKQLEQVTVTFQGYQPDEAKHVECVQLRDQLTKLYDDVQLTMESGESGFYRHMVAMTRVNTGEILADPDGGFLFTLQYEIMFYNVPN